MTSSRRRLLVGAVAAAVSLTVGCSTEDPPARAEPRPVTQAEAERLAVARFTTWDRHYGGFTLQLAVGDQTLFLRGRADFRDHLGYASVITDDRPPTFGLLQWTLTQKALRPAGSDDLPSQPPAGGWQVQPMQRGSELDVALALLLQLAADRPENPLLLRQNGARWVGSTTIDATAVDKMTGPGPDNEPTDAITYFVDAAGTLRRVVAVSASGTQPVVIDLDTTKAAEVAPIPQLRTS